MKSLLFIFFWAFSLLLLISKAQGQSASFSIRLSAQLKDRNNKSQLYFPKSVIRYYAQNSFQPGWIKSKDQAQHTFEAMMLLDCVLQFGLAHADYHPEALVYDELRTMINEPEKIGLEQRVHFDIMLTDAIITLINNLHYGKLNPYFSAKKIDGITKISGFDAVAELIKANGKEDFMAAILTVQPNSKAYMDLQQYMRLVRGQYVGDCYEIPEAQVRKVAINMERLRWREFGGMTVRHKNTVYLTCEIKDGLPVFYTDTLHLDPSLEAAMYYERKALNSQKKAPLLLPRIRLKKD